MIIVPATPDTDERVWSSLYSGLLGCCSASLVFAAPLVVAGALVAPVPPAVTVRFSWQALIAVSRPLCCPSTALRKAASHSALIWLNLGELSGRDLLLLANWFSVERAVVAAVRAAAIFFYSTS